VSDVQCSVCGCLNMADPRWWAHDVSGRSLPICDGHEGTPCVAESLTACTCPPVTDLAYVEHVMAAEGRAEHATIDARITAAILAERARIAAAILETAQNYGGPIGAALVELAGRVSKLNNEGSE
jgi:hypothetical protein